MFTEQVIQRVWEKARIVDGYNGDSIRKDSCGAWILRSQYGNTDSMFGWEIDHVYPVSKGGGDDLQNLRPIQWENNRSKSDNYPNWTSKVSSNGTNNIEKIQYWKIN